MNIHNIINLLCGLLNIEIVEDGACYSFTTDDFSTYCGLSELADALHAVTHEHDSTYVSETRNIDPNIPSFSFCVDDGEIRFTIIIHFEDPSFDEWLINEIEKEYELGIEDIDFE